MTATSASVTLQSIFAQSGDVLYQEVGGEAVLLDLASEQYFGLDTVGTRIWELLDGNATLADVHRVLCAEFEADGERVADDLLALARSLADAGLIRAR